MGGWFSSQPTNPSTDLSVDSTPELTPEQRQDIASKRLRHLSKSAPRPSRLEQERERYRAITSTPTQRDDYIIRDWIQ